MHSGPAKPPAALCCPLTGELMKDPVQLIASGDNWAIHSARGDKLYIVSPLIALPVFTSPMPPVP